MTQQIARFYDAIHADATYASAVPSQRSDPNPAALRMR